MLFSTLLVAATAFTGYVSAQNYSTTSITIDPNSVDAQTRLAWCVSQQTTCPEICGGQAFPNQCDSNTLNYTCTCTNGLMPNISSYAQTIPSFVCQQWVADCVNAHPNDLTGITACRSVICGSLNASSAALASSSASASASATASSSGAAGSSSATATGSSGAAASGSASATAASASASATHSGAAVAMNLASNYGTGILAAGLLAVFGLAL